MTKDQINRIISLPQTFTSPENKESIYSLLGDTGYFRIHDEVQEGDLVEAIESHPEAIREWLSWSSDKRSSSGWYFRQMDRGKAEVGYYGGEINNEPIEFSDMKKACATFIKNEIEDIRTD